MKVQPKKGLGQHFLKDQQIARRIADLAILPADHILEIGPGMGVLTRPLLERFGDRLQVVEIDSESVEYLNINFPELRGRIHSYDFLSMDLKSCFPGTISLIGNYPYNISSQILFHALKYPEQVIEISGMFQREVARRITSQPGTKEYGILSVLLELYYDRKYAFTVSEHVFNPPPKVKSGVVWLSKKEFTPDVDFNEFTNLVKTAFNQRRKMLRNSLSGLIDKSEMDSALFDKRPEQLDLPDFLKLLEIIN
jgi:16S rRNA (adenine1518-N6/adenine1519-N6)-dimethyltransferase